jgi:hypothetical protein
MKKNLVRSASQLPSFPRHPLASGGKKGVE